MRVVCARPPLFAEIDRAFGIAGAPVIFAFGDTIYNPQNVTITPELMAHEEVHGARQRGCASVELWWQAYIADPNFRLGEEVPAHQTEYREFCLRNPDGKARPARRMFLHHVAKRLSSPLYGRLIRYEEARRLVTAASPHASDTLLRHVWRSKAA